MAQQLFESEYSSLKALGKQPQPARGATSTRTRRRRSSARARPTPRSCSSANSPATRRTWRRAVRRPRRSVARPGARGGRYRPQARLCHQRGQALQVATAGKRRIHQKPNAAEIAACRPWLDAELSLLKPNHSCCSAPPHGARRQFRVSKDRGVPVESDLARSSQRFTRRRSCARTTGRRRWRCSSRTCAGSPRPFEPPDRDRDQEAEQDQGRPGDAQPRGESTSGGFHEVRSRLLTCSNQKSRHSTASP